MIQAVRLRARFALAKTPQQEWDDEAMGSRSSPRSLSFGSDNYFESIKTARKSGLYRVKITVLKLTTNNCYDK